MVRHKREEVVRIVHGPRHASQQSQDSAVADSTISNPDSLRLSDYHFPQPPPSLPTTPIQSNFAPPVLDGRMQNNQLPRIAVRRLPPVPESATSRIPQPSETIPRLVPSSKASSIVSPHDWHEGASSLDIDPTEDQLLSTSFITSLLSPWTAQRASSGSDAMSRISEITYPPISVSSSSQVPVRRIPPPEHRPHGARPPPSSYPRLTPLATTKADVESLKSASSDAHTFVVPTSEVPATSNVESQGFSTAPKMTIMDDSSSRRQSIASTRTTAPSFRSRLSSSRTSFMRIFGKSRFKPLPPLPLIADISIAAEREHREAEDATPLPDLLVRADKLEDLLQRGYHPHRSLTSCDITTKGRDLTPGLDIRPERPVHTAPVGSQSRLAVNYARGWLDQSVGKLKRRTLILIVLFLLLVVVVAVVVGVIVGRRTHSSSTCANGMTGLDCSLNATCSCTATSNGACQSTVAQGVLDLVPFLKQEFMPNVTGKDVHDAMWATQIVSCTEQALLIDVPLSLNDQGSPNRAQWARTAILWNFIESQDPDAAKQLREFVLQAPWTDLQKNLSSDQTYSINLSGFTFNFASQTIITPPQSFRIIGQPSADQDSRVNPVTRSTLDYIYGNAVASSAQHHTSLTTYWLSDLGRQAHELQIFINAVSMSPIVLPFDATSGSISHLLSVSTSATHFPPPLACYPGLDQTSTDTLNMIENGFFNMSRITSQSNFSLTCYPDHPIYGFLDVLQLRLPPAGFPLQASLLQSSVAPRAVVYNGQLRTLSNGSWRGAVVAPVEMNATQFGTLNHLEHVILDYFKAMDAVNTSLAHDVVDFVLSSVNTPHVPPEGSLLSSIDQIPLIGVAVFGSVEVSDIRLVESSFTADSGSLFFGSPGGEILRNWTIASINSTLTWAQNSTSPEIVRDNNLTDNRFNQIWNAASTAIKENEPNAIVHLTQSLTAFGYFTP